MTMRRIEATPSKKVIFDSKVFFVIFLGGNQIVVEHYQNISKGTSMNVDTGKLNSIIFGKDALSIGQTIIREGLISRIDHSLYLGKELMKAEIALKFGLRYEQCSELVIPDLKV